MDELKDTINFMNSEDYTERFIAEYWQLKIRYESLQNMLFAYRDGSLEFVPTCSEYVLQMQLDIMKSYLSILEYRAALEKINIERWGE